MAGSVVHRAAARHSGKLHIGYLCMFVMASGIRGTSGLVTTPCGLENGRCDQLCRKTTCEALLDFYNGTYSATRPWAIKHGWETAIGTTCTQILRSPDFAPPEYCRWYGVSCCWDGMISANMCSVKYSLVGLALPVDDLTGNISSSQFMQAVTQLHECGLTQITLDGNALYGSLTNDWGQLTNLTQLSIGKAAILQDLSERS